MEARAVVRHVRMSPRKMRVVANLVRGKRVDEAMSMLKLMPKKGATVIRKLIISAVANAEHAGINDVDQLTIRDCNVDNGPILKRWMPRSNSVSGGRRASLPAICPNTVALPVWTTSMRAVPLATLVPMKTQLLRSLRLSFALATPDRFSTGKVSPVSTA